MLILSNTKRELNASDMANSGKHRRSTKKTLIKCPLWMLWKWFAARIAGIGNVGEFLEKVLAIAILKKDTNPLRHNIAISVPTEKGKTMIVKVKILCPLPGVYAEYQPEVGKIYEASYKSCKWNPGGSQHASPVCVIDVKDKKICLRQREYEIVG